MPHEAHKYKSKIMNNKLPPHFASVFSFPKKGKLTPEQAQDLRDTLDNAKNYRSTNYRYLGGYRFAKKMGGKIIFI